MLNELTKYQESQIKPWFNKWSKIALSTEPADINKFKRAIIRFCDNKKIPRPKKFIFVPSLVAGAKLLVSYSSLSTNLQILYKTKSEIINSALISSEIWNKISHIDIFHVPRMILSGFVFNELRNNTYHGYEFGQFGIFDGVRTSYFREVCGLKFPKYLFEDIAAFTGCWWWLDNFIIVSDRPRQINIDENNRLHSTTGPAIEWRDGSSLYAWHNTLVPAKLITNPDDYTSEEIKKLENTEMIRALAEKLGWEKYINKLGIEVIDSYTDSKTGLKYELLDSCHKFGRDDPRYIRKQSSKLKDGSSPWYIEPVHPRLKTAAAARKFQAMAAFLDDPNEEYKLVQYCNRNPELNYNWER